LLIGRYFYCNKDEEKALYELVQGEYVMDDTPGIDNAQTKKDKLYNYKPAFMNSISKLNTITLEEDAIPDLSDPLMIPEKFDKLVEDYRRINEERSKRRRELIKQRRKELRSPKFLREIFKIMEDETNSEELFQKLSYKPKERKRRREYEDEPEVRKLPLFYYGLE
jgi:hypothetical protein